MLVYGSTSCPRLGGALELEFPFLAVVFAGAVSALFVNVFSVVPDDKPVKPSARTS